MGGLSGWLVRLGDGRLMVFRPVWPAARRDRETERQVDRGREREREGGGERKRAWAGESWLDHLDGASIRQRQLHRGEHDEDVHAPPQCMYTQDVVSWTDARACRLATALPFQRTAQDQPAHAAGDGFGGPVVAAYHTYHVTAHRRSRPGGVSVEL